MKKVFYIALAALAFAACSKTEANFTASQEISFMPVSKFDTKAAVEGTKFTADQNFYVFANTVVDNKKYFDNVLFVPEQGNTVGNLQVYKGNPTQYWPNVLALKFAGVTQSGNVTPANTKVGKTNFNEIGILEYEQPSPTSTDAKNDLMYFFDDNNGAGYTKGTSVVSPTMKHACSWLTINIEAEESLVTYWSNLKVIDVTLLKLHEKGSVSLPANDASAWDLFRTTADVNVLNVEKTINAVAEDKVEFANIPNNTIVLPQTPVQLSVTYSYTTPAGVNNFTETKVLDLYYDDAKTPWQPGMHYTYNLTLTAEEIKIAPSSTDWDTTSTDKTI